MKPSPRINKSVNSRELVSLKYPRLLLWVLKVFFPSLNDSKRALLLQLMNKLEFRLHNRGRLWCSDQSKLAQLAILRFLEGRPLSSPSGIAMTRSGLPKILGSEEAYRAISQRDLIFIKAVLSVLQMTRLLKGGKPLNLDTITGPWTGHLPLDVVGSIPGFVKYHKFSAIDTEWDKFHFTTKAGPNGPALATCLHDWRALTPSMKACMSTIGGSELKFWIDRYDRVDETNPGFLDRVGSTISGLPVDQGKLKVSKISVKADVDCKSRLFGILDYWTQTSLVPLNKSLYKLLRRIPSDQTFNQTEGLLSFRPDKGSKFHSIDLTAATDRFPVLLQRNLLGALIGLDKANAWMQLLTDRVFHLKGEPLQYEVGQPMGAYSSWSAFALTHHLVVFAAIRRAGLPDSWSNYKLLGDDIVIGNDQVALHYGNIMKELGCEFSEAKTFRSDNFFEFAKRLFYQGTEFSPFPLVGLLEVRKQYHLLFAFLQILPERGFYVPSLTCDNLDWIAELFQISGKSGRLTLSLTRNMKALAIVPSGNSVTSEQAGEAFKGFARLFGISISCNISLHKLGLIFSEHMRAGYS